MQSQAVLPNVQLGTVRKSKINVALQDLGIYEKGYGHAGDGILGADFLRRENLASRYR